MRRIPTLAAWIAATSLVVATIPPAHADLVLPRISPNATVSQTIGATTITLTSSRPGVKGRPIWGALVPYDKVWRTGANEATTFEVSTDCTVNGQPLPAGTYSLHTIPSTGDWTVIFNRVAKQWGSFAYSDTADALRLKVRPEAHEFTEWMSFSFPEVDVDKATIALDWEKLRVPFEVEVKTVDTALASARAAMASLAPDDFNTPYRAAAFAFQNNVALDEARAWLEKSLSIKQTWLNLRLKADMLAKAGDAKGAIDYAQRAIATGKAATPPAPADELAKIEEEVAGWKKM